MTETDHFARARSPHAISCAEIRGGREEAHITTSPVGIPVIGRERELADLAAALDSAIEGRGGLVMLVGEPGIGKTRLAEELTAVARDRGALVAWGNCFEGGSTPPFWPWVQAIRSLLTEPSDATRSALDARAAVIAEIVPEIADITPGLKPAPELDPEQGRFRLFDSVTSFLNELATSKPLVVVLDDLHWADRSTLDLLEFVAQDISSKPVLLIGGYRDMELSRRHPLSETLATLARARGFQRITLRGLESREVGQLVEVVGDIALTSELIEEIHGRTEGNPFFVTEVTRDLSREAARRGGDFDAVKFRIPEGVREAIGIRLNRVSESCNDVLTQASVIGRRFSLAQLQAVVNAPNSGNDSSITEDRLLDVLEEAVAAHIVEELPESVGEYQFTHALIEQTLADELSPTRKVRMHARIAEALEALYGDDAEKFANELAIHYEQAQTVLGTDRMVKYSVLAGKAANDSLGYAESLIHFERAWEALKDEPMDDRLAGIIWGLARAEISAAAEPGRLVIGVDHALEAFDYYVATEQVDNAIAIAVMPFLSFGIDSAVKLNQKAVELVDDDHPSASYLLSQYAVQIANLEGRFDEATQYFERAINLARSRQDLASEALALSRMASVEFVTGRARESLQICLDCLEVARSAGERLAEFMANNLAAVALIGLGRTAEAVEHGDIGHSLAITWRDNARIAQLFPARAIPRILAGRWDEIDEMVTTIEAKTVSIWVIKSQLAVQRGHGSAREYADDTREMISEAFAQRNPIATWFLASYCLVLRRSRISADFERAADWTPFQEMISSSSSHSWTVVEAFYSLHSADHFALSKSYGKLCEIDLIVVSNVVLQTLLGEIAAMLGNTETAEQHFELAIEQCRDAGWSPEIAWAEYSHAEMLLERAAPGDNEKAAELLGEAIGIAAELGMAPLEKRLLVLREKADSTPAHAPAYPDGLTAREVEVLKEIAVGKSNREIAEALFISQNTVIRHVANIFSKTGSANRAQAAVYAAERGLK